MPLETDFMWISLMDYAARKGVSLSTLRRYIKAEKIKYKLEAGRYLIYCDDSLTPEAPAPSVAKLQNDLRSAREEVEELKMLVALYEEKIANRMPEC